MTESTWLIQDLRGAQHGPACSRAGDLNDIPWNITVPLGIIGALLSLPAWIFFIRGAAQIFTTIRLGQPALKRTDNPAGRLMNLIKEIVGHTKMAKKPGVAIAHWLVMVGFLLGSMVWFEAYIQIFDPEGGWPIIGGWACTTSLTNCWPGHRPWHYRPDHHPPEDWR